jgi:hypothetical protein
MSRNMTVNSIGEVYLGKAPLDLPLQAGFLSEADTKTVSRIDKLQRINDGRFRIYGGRRGGREWIRLVTEFTAFEGDRQFWKDVKALARKVGAEIETLDRRKHLDRVSHDNGKTWINGKDHGRPERQIEFFVDVRGLSVAGVRKKRRALAKATKGLWKRAGICVC